MAKGGGTSGRGFGDERWQTTTYGGIKPRLSNSSEIWVLSRGLALCWVETRKFVAMFYLLSWHVLIRYDW